MIGLNKLVANSSTEKLSWREKGIENVKKLAVGVSVGVLQLKGKIKTIEKDD